MELGGFYITFYEKIAKFSEKTKIETKC